jgi:hypothetical protein
MKTPISSLVKLGACHGALAWCRTNSMPDLETAWLKCPRGDWMEWLATKRNADPKKPADWHAKRAALDADWLAKRDALYADYEAKRDALYADYEAKRDALDAKRDALDAKRDALDADWYAKRDALYADYEAKRDARDADWRAKCADLMREIFPVLPENS